MSVANVRTEEPDQAPTNAAAGSALPHLRGLDGLRGLAVLGVLFFHGGFWWATGGFLGVSLFFTLSGYLITSLLLAERSSTKRIDLNRFWTRRVRRLLPAALAAISAVAIYGWFFASNEQRINLRGDLLGSLCYVANWRFVARGSSYADIQSGQSLVQHFWSLAIEEQFYVIWPLLAAGALALWSRRGLSIITGLLIAASVGCCIVMWNVLDSSTDTIYFSTQTRVAEILIGAALALALPLGGRRSTTKITRRAISVTAPIALIIMLILWVTTSQTSPWLYNGGFSIHALLAAAVIAAVVLGGTVCDHLSWKPLAAVGLISYGLYLYHWPIFAILTEDRVGLGQYGTFIVRMGVTVAIALLSYRFLEQPIRRGSFPGNRKVWIAVPVAMALVAGLVLIATRDTPKIAYADYDTSKASISMVENDGSSAATTSSTVKITSPAPRALMTVGDSSMYDETPALRASFFAIGTQTSVETAFPGIGLTYGGAANWREDWKKKVDENTPELSVVMLGGFDHDFITANGPDAYRPIVDELVALLTSRGGRVVWLSILPCGRVPDAAQNAVYAELTDRYPGKVAYIDTSPAFEGCPQTKTQDDGTVVKLRKSDKWHLCPAGAAHLATFVHEKVYELGWAPAPTTGWEWAPWTSDARFEECRTG